jgi:putative two-component system response regulator
MSRPIPNFSSSASQESSTPLSFPTQRHFTHSAKILIVDDEASNVAMLEDMLEEASYNNVRSTTDPQQVLALYRDFAPDIVLLDLMMPGLDGMAVMEQIRNEQVGSVRVPIVMLTANISYQVKQRALSCGANDFLTKPIDAIELLLRIENLLENRFLYLDLQHQNTTLDERVQARTAQLEEARTRITIYVQELEEAHFETLELLARAGEFRDDDTGQHTQRVGVMAATLAQRIGLPADQVRLIQQAARLHDIGKVAIPDAILLKPGKLSDDEFTTMKTHAAIGAMLFEVGRSDLVKMAQRIAHSHHERWDGNGYPQRLRKAEIPIEARLVSVADVFDALTHDRPYKKAWPIKEAVAEIQRQSERQFDPQIVQEFLKLNLAAPAST